MKRLDSTEKSALVLAGAFIIVGGWTAIYPSEITVLHPSGGRYQPAINRVTPVEHISRRRSRIYGIGSVALGVGLTGLVFYRPRK